MQTRELGPGFALGAIQFKSPRNLESPGKEEESSDLHNKCVRLGAVCFDSFTSSETGPPVSNELFSCQCCWSDFSPLLPYRGVSLLQAALMSYHKPHGTAFTTAPSCADHRRY